MDLSQLENYVQQRLEEFYQQRLTKLKEVQLKDILEGQNLYLLSIYSGHRADDIVTRLLQRYISLESELIIDDLFFGLRAMKDEEPELFYNAIQVVDRLIHDKPIKARFEFENEWVKTCSRLTFYLLVHFTYSDGSVNWKDLLRFAGGDLKTPKAKEYVSIEIEYEDDEDEEIEYEDYEDDDIEEEDIGEERLDE